MRALITFATLAFLGGCSSVLTPTLDETTGTTLAQRCVDYRTTVASYEALRDEGNELSGVENAAYEAAKAFLIAYCPVEPVSKPDVLG